MRGFSNIALVVNVLSRKKFEKGLFGMIGKEENNWMDCSLDGIAVIDLDKDTCIWYYAQYRKASSSSVGTKLNLIPLADLHADPCCLRWK
jgi:hypothetical protein